MNDILVPIALFFFLFGAPVLAFVVTRVLAHRERLEMIRHGIVPPPSGRRAYRQWQQQSGPAPSAPWQTPPPVPPAAAWAGYDDEPQRALYKGIRTAFIGLALLLGLSFIGGTPLTPGFHGGPWLLGGLIPMFVGIAQMIIAVLGRAPSCRASARRHRARPTFRPRRRPGRVAPISPARRPGARSSRGAGPFEEIGRPPAPPEPR